MSRSKNETYVGDTFFLNLPKEEKHPLEIYNGFCAKLIGFKKKLYPIFMHTSDGMYQPGIYEGLGDPLLRLETGVLVELPLTQLKPDGYTFSERNTKNWMYQQARDIRKWISPLPFISCQVGDLVLVSKHGKLKDDLVGTISDIELIGKRVSYKVCDNDQLVLVPSNQIIDTLELGYFSEAAREHSQLETLAKMMEWRGTFFED